jgi:thiosulfate/3-mercaptopyruvate sulfurtransferase
MSLPTPLISAEALLHLLTAGPVPVILDTSFELGSLSAGETAFLAGHLPGALYAHLADDLSGPLSAEGPQVGGRHPLPTREHFALTVGRWGIRPQTPVVIYDNQGASYAGRAWWMLRWLGHTQVAVLDGGLAAWIALGGGLESGPGTQAGAAPAYPLDVPAMPTVDAQALLSRPGDFCVLDARAGERFRGEVEPLDPQAGHIPGARNRFFKDNLVPDGRFRPADELREVFLALGQDPSRIVHQCGSGVTACHNLLAMEIAGLPGASLYPGSWSEWCADPRKPIARGG